MTDDDIEFDEADLVRLQRLEAMMQDRGYRRDQLRILEGLVEGAPHRRAAGRWGKTTP